jgi:DNA-binding response OmpR family regulator
MSVIIIEDNKISAVILKKHLEKIFKNVSVFDKGFPALEYIKNNKYDIFLILIDIMLPDINGIDILKEIREYEITHNFDHSVILMVSALNDSSNITKALKFENADGYITKPVNFKKLNVELD